jgi:hypothetical protein|tara:strand:- start:24336 stop:24452 length:117 start_codon:yes stop_codon:yes gene_type:complete
MYAKKGKLAGLYKLYKIYKKGNPNLKFEDWLKQNKYLS